MTLPFAGHPVGARNAKEAKGEEDKIESAYRFLLADLMPFGKNARICLEHGGTNESTEHYETVTYWYGTPSPSLVQTDELRDRRRGQREAHRYPIARCLGALRDHVALRVGSRPLCRQGSLSRAHGPRDDPREGTSEFTLKLEARNLGVLLRRKLDYAFPNQRAEVFVADAGDRHEGKQLEWKPAGHLVSAGFQHLRVLQPEGGTGRRGAHGADLQPAVPGRRVPRAARADRGTHGHPRPRPVHAREEAALPRPSVCRPGLERDPLHAPIVSSCPQKWKQPA